MKGLFSDDIEVSQNAVKNGRTIDTKFRQYPYLFYGRSLLLQGFEKQGLEYLVSNGYNPKDIRAECELKGILDIKYVYKNKTHTYLPDLYIISEKKVIEVKSIYTLGIEKSISRGWAMTQAKAQATIKRGYKFTLLLLDETGRNVELPNNWYTLSKKECLKIIGNNLRPTKSRSLF